MTGKEQKQALDRIAQHLSIMGSKFDQPTKTSALILNELIELIETLHQFAGEVKAKSQA